MTTTEYFTPSWRRPIRKNDTFHSSSSSSSSSSPSSSSNNNNHNPNDNNNNNNHHLPLKKLWDEKSSLESKMWENKNKCTNPFDDDYGKEVHEYPIVGKFWHDEPRCEMDRVTTRYCVVLLQLVQLLGRGESWRIATGGVSNDNIDNNDNNNNEENNSKNNNVKNNNNTTRRSPGNPHCREIAIDLAHTLLHLDRTDMRVRLYLPSLLMDGEYYQEAYDFLKHWLRPNASLFIMDLALMGGPMMTSGEEDDDDDEEDGTTTTGDYYFDPTDVASGGDATENPERWMDGEMVYPSIGMVFELAYLKCHLLCELRSGRFHSSSDAATTSFEESTEEEGEEEEDDTKPRKSITLARACIDAGETELQRQVHLLLSLVHKWNPHLLPNLDGPYNITAGASTLASHSASSLRNEGFAVSSYANAAPPALSALLNRHPPGFELQYKMGNPGGGTEDEAVGIWQRDVMMWHDLDPRTMVFLAEFCRGLDGNLVDVGCLRGGEVVEGVSKGGMGGGGGSGGGIPYTEKEEDAENVAKRKEAEELVRKLQREKPDRTMGEIMMHPEMAQLMVKHLHTG